MERCIGMILDLADTAGYECEVYGESTRRFQIEVYRGCVESIDGSRDAGIGVRIVRDLRVGHSFTSDLTPEGCIAVFERARENAAASSPLDADVLADVEREELAVSRRRAFPSEGNTDDKIESVIAMERACFDYGPSITNTESAGYSEIEAEIVVAGTRGFHRREKRGYSSCSVTAVASRGGEVRSGWDYRQNFSHDEIDFTGVGTEAARKATVLLGSGRISTGRYPVVVSGPAFNDIIGIVEKALSGEMAVKGTTFFAGRLGERIASACVTVVDDPRMEGGCFNASFDAEGVATRRNVLVREGILENFLCNTYAARKLGVQFAGNAVRPSFKKLPIPGPSNLHIVAGQQRSEELLAEVEEGVYVQDIMGIHTADPISGDFSVGISGHFVRSGRLRNPVAEMTMSGNLLELLRSVRAVGTDPSWIGQYGSPGVLIEGLSLSGS